MAKANAGQLHELEAAIREYVGHLRRCGFSAEHVIVRIKADLAHSGFVKDDRYVNQFIDDVVTLAIREFYRGSASVD